MSRIILFDIDMTLIRTGGAGGLAIRRVFQRRFGIADALAAFRLDGMVDHDIFLRCLEGIEDPDGSHYAICKDEYFAELTVAIKEREGEVLPGVEALLAALADDGTAALGLATGNYRESTRIKLAHFGLWERFPAGGFGDGHTLRADVVRQAGLAVAETHGVTFDPAETWVIGDTPRDIDAAKAIGARTIAVATGNYSIDELAGHRPDRVYGDLSDTAAVLHDLMTEGSRPAG